MIKKQEPSLLVASASPDLLNAALIALTSGGMVLLAIAAKLIRDYALPHYVSAIGSFVFGFAAVLIFQQIIGYLHTTKK